VQSQPNILLIMADQMVPFLTGAYDHPVVKTPNLDRLAAEGIRFDAAYSPCPVCAPARACLMTGRHMSRIGAYDNGAGFGFDQPTFAHYLTLAGYDTVLAGKMHFIGPDQLHGFARRFNTNIYPAGFDWTPQRGLEHVSERTHALKYLGEAVHVDRWSDYLSYDKETHLRAREYLHAKGVERFKAMEGQVEASKPFFLCASYHHPHEPFWPPQAYWDLYEGSPIEVPEFPENLEDTYTILDRWLNTNHGVAKAPGLRKPESMRRLRRAYYALVSYIDDKVGELLSTLHQSGLDQDTIVVFTSDHGDMLVERGMVQKRCFYEWSSRVPLIVRFPDGRLAGTTRPEPVSLIDLAPTFLDFARTPASERLEMDGRSLVGLLEGSDAEDWEAISEYHSQGAHTPCFMIRQGDYKYVHIHGYPDRQLFDLSADPGEWNNLAGKPETHDIQARLEARLLELFEPDAIDAAIQESIARRQLIKRAMQASNQRWDAEPRFDPHKGMLEAYLDT
jgi:choline-sulfatase